MNTNGYVVLRNILDKQTLDILKIQSKLLEKQKCFKINKYPNEYPFGDIQCPTSFASYGALIYEALMLFLQPIIEQHCCKELLPTYSYMRIYYKNSILLKHTDRPSCEYSATVCISTDEKPWDIFFKKCEKEVCVSLNAGDIIIYKGQELEHWRDKYDGNEQIQAFLHYVDKNGSNSNLIYDKRPFIGIEK
jgi:hypothetical protein